MGSSTTIKQIVTLDLGGSELIQSLEFEAKKHIPLDGTEVIMDYHVIGDNVKEAGKIDVLLVATTKNLINQHDQLISEIGFKNRGIFDATPIALANLHTFNKGVPEQGTDVIINIGNANHSVLLPITFNISNQMVLLSDMLYLGHSSRAPNILPLLASLMTS